MGETVKKIRVGIVGCGRVSVMHLVSIASLEETELVACCDIKQERAEETAKKYGAKPYLSYEGGKDYWGFQHIRQIRQFNNALLGKEELEISGEVALKTHRLIMEIYKMGKAGMQ